MSARADARAISSLHQRRPRGADPAGRPGDPHGAGDRPGRSRRGHRGRHRRRLRRRTPRKEDPPWTPTSRPTSAACRRPPRPESASSQTATTLHLRLAPVVKRLAGTPVRMLAYNGSVPGPTLRVRQGSEITVHVTNETDLETTVHWHGLRLDNSQDGVPRMTQPPIPPGGDVHLPAALPRRRPVLVPPARPRGLHAGNGPLRRRSWSTQPIRRTGPRRTATSCSRSTTCSSRTARSRRSAAPRRTSRRWAATATRCSSPAKPTSP